MTGVLLKLPSLAPSRPSTPYAHRSRLHERGPNRLYYWPPHAAPLERTKKCLSSLSSHHVPHVPSFLPIFAIRHLRPAQTVLNLVGDTGEEDEVRVAVVAALAAAPAFYCGDRR